MDKNNLSSLEKKSKNGLKGLKNKKSYVEKNHEI